MEKKISRTITCTVIHYPDKDVPVPGLSVESAISVFGGEMPEGTTVSKETHTYAMDIATFLQYSTPQDNKDYSDSTNSQPTTEKTFQ